MKLHTIHNTTLAAAWLAARATQQWEDFEAFAEILYEECCRQVPSERLGASMVGREPEVRQETCLILLGTFLANNPHLVGEQNLRLIGRHLVKSVAICTRYAISRLARYGSRSREVSTTDVTIFGVANHPRCKTYADLTYDEKRAVALSALQLAAEEISLSEKNIKIARLILDEGLSPREAARRLGVSPSAIHQQLVRVASTLAILKDAVEIEIPQP